ncbi:hypothetical protein M408DRAFT_331708 [Serendipita vermifera MAFF 305830]|uniref:Amino acid permease/ SLC12A domain-containing protein n=1 Tax=Serendipita vermifera MAFF 305830 TaxID=933852 RepID=A0A0C3AX98_SERVB|nr:hypothetical protein M408DRAFT_331708 [Serendipita vermifera MAFF 305830]
MSNVYNGPNAGHYVNELHATPNHGPSQISVTSEDFEVSRIHGKAISPIGVSTEKTLRRELNANQITMITLGGTLGTGLLVGSGSALNEGGPLGIVIAYIIVCAYFMMTSLAEMSTYLPDKKGFVGLVTRYVHPSIGFALGWTYMCRFLVVPASHINTAAVVVFYGGGGNQVPIHGWRLIFIVGVNFLGIRAFGHFEFWLSTLKVTVLVALILFGLVIDLGGAPLKEPDSRSLAGLAGLFWRPPYGPFGNPAWAGENIYAVGDTLRFVGFWSTLVKSLFSLMGMELLGVTVGEAENPYRLVLSLYLLAVITMGFICSSDDPTFWNDTAPLGDKSPFIIAARRLVANGIVPVISAAIAVFALSGATSNIYTGSRILYGLSLDGQGPAWLRKKVTSRGQPLVSLGLVTVFCLLSFVGEAEQAKAFDYFVDVTTTAGAISWICIFWAHIRFRKALKAQHYPLDTLRYVSSLHPIGTYFALVATVIITMFKGVGSYADRGFRGCIAAYILIVFYLLLLGGWCYWRTGLPKPIPLNEIDLDAGRREIDEEEVEWNNEQSMRKLRPWWRRISDYT